MDTIDISQHKAALCDLAQRYRMPVSEVIDKIIAHGIEGEIWIFDWSPSPLIEVEDDPVEEPLAEAQRQSA